MLAKRIIPLRRTLVILLTLLFASAIFSSSISIIYSLNNFNEYLYGGGDNVLVIYDTLAQTPFTSRVPASYDSILKEIDGVITTSPESMIPGIVKKQPILMRGVNFTAFSQFHSIKIIEGRSLQNEDISTAIIGKSLAKRLDISVGQVISFFGSVRNNEIILQIVGKYSSQQSLEDEILVRHSTAEKVARRGNEYNHIKVKFDPDKVTSDQILNIIKTRYNPVVSVMFDNNTKPVEDWHLNIFDWETDLIYSKQINTTTSINLPFGEYSFEVVSSGGINFHEEILVSSNDPIILNSERFSYQTNISIVDNVIPTTGYIEIHDEQNIPVYQGYKNDSDMIPLTLKEGTYKLYFTKELNLYEDTFVITRSQQIEIDISNSNLLQKYEPTINQLNDVTGTNSNVTLRIQNQNYNFTSYFYGVIELTFANGTSDQIVTDELITLPADVVSIKPIVTAGYNLENKNYTVSPNTNQVIIFSTQVKTDSGLIIIQNDFGLEESSILIQHQFLPNSINPTKTSDGWFVSNFPIGPIEITMRKLGKLQSFNGTFNPAIKTLVISLQGTENLKEDKFLALESNISGDLATQFFNEEFSGPFAFLNLALLAETVLIIILLLVNVSGVYAGLIAESRYEIRTVKSIGFSKVQIIFSILFDTFKFSIIVTLLGNILGLRISQLLVNTNNTVLFGHTFLPGYPLVLWIVNLIVVHFVLIVATWIGLKLEQQSVIEAN